MKKSSTARGNTEKKSTSRPRPSPEELTSAYGKTIPDVIGPNLLVLFVGINPSLYSAAVGHHFARPGNRFWPALHTSGFTDRRLSPEEDQALLKQGCGITNLVDRATARADELTSDELRAGTEQLRRKVARDRPRRVAILGMTAYRIVSGRKGASIGLQPERFEGSELWVLPNPSGLNAHYQLPDFTRLFRQLRNRPPL